MIAKWNSHVPYKHANIQQRHYEKVPIDWLIKRHISLNLNSSLNL